MESRLGSPWGLAFDEALRNLFAFCYGVFAYRGYYKGFGGLWMVLSDYLSGLIRFHRGFKNGCRRDL